MVDRIVTKTDPKTGARTIYVNDNIIYKEDVNALLSKQELSEIKNIMKSLEKMMNTTITYNDTKRGVVVDFYLLNGGVPDEEFDISFDFEISDITKKSKYLDWIETDYLLDAYMAEWVQDAPEYKKWKKELDKLTAQINKYPSHIVQEICRRFNQL